MYSLQNISREFNNKKRSLFALKDISIGLPSKGLVIIRGESGSGKTTLLNILSGLDKPTEGRLFFNNVDFTDKAESELSKYRNSAFGIIFQELNLIDNFSVRDNILLSVKLQNKEVDLDKLNNILKLLDIVDLIDAFPYELSGGEKQRVALARALMKESKVYFADEPTSSLDKKNADIIMNTLKKISLERLVILVSHDTNIINKYADYYLELSKGIIKSTDLKEDYDFEENIIKPISSKLPIKYSLKMSLANLLRNPIKLFFAFLTMILAFSFVQLAISLSAFDGSVSLENSMIKEKEFYGSISKQDLNKRSLFFDEMNMELISSQLLHINPIYYADSISRIEATNELCTNIVGAAVFNDSDLGKYHMSLTGTFPNEENEIALTTYNALILWIDITDYAGKTIKLNDRSFNITGIVDTNYANATKLGQEAEDTQLLFGPHRLVFLSDNRLNDLKDSAIGGYKYVLTSEKATKVIDFLNVINKDSNTTYTYNNKITHIAYSTEYFVASFDDLLVYTSIIFSLLAIFLLVNQIYGEIIDDIKYIRILKSLGISNRNLYSIYIFSNLLITILSYIVSFFVFFGAKNFINDYLRKELNVVVPLINVVGYVTAFIFLMALIVSFLTTSLSLLIYSKKEKTSLD